MKLLLLTVCATLCSCRSLQYDGIMPESDSVPQELPYSAAIRRNSGVGEVAYPAMHILRRMQHACIQGQ